MDKLPPGWKLSIRDDERHRLDWSMNHPEKLQEEKEKLKQELIKMHEELGDNINLKEEYPHLF